MSRSSSMSQPNPNPFAFGIESVPSNPFDHPQSRPPTSGGPRTHAESPEYDEDDGDDSDDENPSTARNMYQTSPQAGASEERLSTSTTTTPPGSSTRRGSRTSPSAEGGSASHGNEVPAEYKTEVEQIFFDFLNKTCSNRTWHSQLCSIQVA